MSLSGSGRKRKGSRNELRTMRWLEEQGYSCTKSGGSLGMWDVIATHPEKAVRLIQAKSNRRPGRDEMGRMIAFRAYGCRKELVVWKDYAREPVVVIL